jgi:hypothetical protein
LRLLAVNARASTSACAGDNDYSARPRRVSGGDKVTPASWMGFAGSVLGGSITMFGLFIATRNVNRQLRINLISREEERIEEQLPGLNQARDELRRFLAETDQFEVMNDLEDFGEVAVDPIRLRSNASACRRHKTAVQRQVTSRSLSSLSKIVYRLQMPF